VDDATRAQLLGAAAALPIVGPLVQLYTERREARRLEAARTAPARPATGLAPAPAAAAPRPTPPPPRHFSDAEREAFRAVAPYLRPNPRHIKRVVNVYALVRALADGRGETRILADPEATVRWLALCAQWPYAAREMLRRLDAIDAEQARAREGGREARDPDAAPLAHLLALVEPGLDRARRARFDHEPAVLSRLAATSGGLSWDEMRLLRRYTLNFNPALESELRGAASPASVEG
jgi:hypothetical protein